MAFSMSMQERRQLVLDVMDHVNFYPYLFEKKNFCVIGKLLHVLTDPREMNPIPIQKGTRAIAALKRNKELWNKVKTFMIPDTNYWSGRRCKCLHYTHSHAGKEAEGKCQGTDSQGKSCKCVGFTPRDL